MVAVLTSSDEEKVKGLPPFNAIAIAFPQLFKSKAKGAATAVTYTPFNAMLSSTACWRHLFPAL